MRKLFAYCVAGAFLSGCQTADDTLITSSAPVSISGPAASAVAGDMASRLAEQIGSAGGTTTIVMHNDKSEFGTALEAALKGWGYRVVPDGKVSKTATLIELAYAIEGFDGQILARVSTSSIALSRAYAPSAAGAAPTSPLSIMQRN
ncbi:MULTISPECIES: conjugal transfer protein TrbH [unclassified Rhizobium]|uniref:conjugal transfer protein TrbH n=1 Tax=unclassified Rhizobium TaxID=2613769 RepID=UPI001784B0FA|nr:MULTISPECIES: conjugal transfer protein TrbH [unclassified Rhizobium]MBD8689532.1 conjugal transfer protein TrbH [Rhizobium sp. CFBP 13644]MBD8693946.1 conjugal transfer protein TrbH [Rhizobium sp. CFBP 13717]